MNETTHEQLSALLDGELPRDELRFLLRRLDADAELAQRWSRYQIASAALKRRSWSADADRFAASVLARLEADEAPSARARVGARLLRWAGGGAIAASVAVVALMAGRPAEQPGAPGAPNLAEVAAPATPQPLAAVDRALPMPQQALPDEFARLAQPAGYESIIPNYTQRYVGATSLGGSEAFVPYVLIVGSRQSLQPQPAPRAESAQH
jgi:sigma-E factor negative regulatory protein RseA